MAEGATPDIGNVIGALMANPDAVAGIMNVLKTSGIHLDKPANAEFTEKTEEPAVETVAEAHEDVPPPPLPPPPRHRPDKKDREVLLHALLPYLSDKKQARLLQLIRMADMMELFGKMGGK